MGDIIGAKGKQFYTTYDGKSKTEMALSAFRNVHVVHLEQKIYMYCMFTNDRYQGICFPDCEPDNTLV